MQPDRVRVSAEDLIAALTTQRNAALDEAAQLKAALEGVLREKTEAAKSSAPKRK